MKKTKKICYKLLALILVCVITCSVNSAEVVHAAGISKDRAEQMYVYVLKKWLAQGVYVTVNNDIGNYVTNTKKGRQKESHSVQFLPGMMGIIRLRI